MSTTEHVLVCGGFDDIRSRDIRFLEEAAKFGALEVRLLTDDEIAARTGRPPKFPYAERQYFLQALRFVENVSTFIPGQPHLVGCVLGRHGDEEAFVTALAERIGAPYRCIAERQLDGFPPCPHYVPDGRAKVVVTGCYDWFHSGHIRFFEDAGSHGELTVCVGNDACIRELKGAGHPLLPQDERRYVVGAIRYVSQALVSQGMGWLDADAEIRALKPDYYAVNEDGDKGGKREYAASLGISYLVLHRTPAAGLPQRSSTALRGF